MSQASQIKTVLGQDCRIKGELALDNDAVIMGEFDGTIRVSGLLELAPSAKVSGTIIAGAVRLAGYADADIVAIEGLEVLKDAQLVGKIYTGRLTVAEGAVFQGQVSVGPDAIDKAQSLIEATAQASDLPDVDYSTPSQVEMADEYDDEDVVDVAADEQAQPAVRESSLDAMLQRRRRATTNA